MAAKRREYRNLDTKSLHALFHSKLHYDPTTGIFTWIQSPSKRPFVGEIAGWVETTGYIRICIQGYGQIGAHRLAWFMHYGCWPKNKIDHLNLDKQDNRIENLREASDEQNSRNFKSRVGMSGHRGVTVKSGNATRPYRAAVYKKRKPLKVAYFATLEEAVETRRRWAAEEYGSFNCE